MHIFTKDSLDLISQIGITVFGIAGAFLVARKNKWGFVLGLISQPFWFITSIANQQWGVFALSVVYTANWVYGIYNWFKPNQKDAPHTIPPAQDA